MAKWKKTFVCAFTAQVFSIIGLSFANPFLPFFIEELGITDKGEQAFWAGIVFASTGLTFVLFAPLWGMLADKYSRKLMVCRSMIGATVILFLISYVNTVGQLTVCRLLYGAFTGTIGASVALVASITPKKHSGLTLGMMQAAVFIGHTIGPFFGGLMADAFGYRMAFRAGALLCFLGGLLIYFGAADKQHNKDQDIHNEQSGFKSIFLLKGFFIAVLIMFGVRLSNTLTNPSFPLIIKDILPNAANINSIAGSVIAVAALSGAISAALLGHASDKFGQKRVLLACCIGACFSSIAHYTADTIIALVIARVLFGFSVAGMLPSANAMIHSIIDPRSLGKAYGLATSLSMLGTSIGPFVGGYVARAFTLRTPFLITAAAQLTLAAIILITFTERNKKPDQKT